MKQFVLAPSKSHRWRIVVGVAVLVTGLLAGYLRGVPSPPPAVMAATCGTAFSCGSDGTASAAVTIGHEYEDPNTHTVYNVEPATTDTIEVTARWYSNNVGVPCNCQQLSTAQAAVTVSWSDAGQAWTATCTSGCDATNGPIRGVSVCPDGDCGGLPPDHAWQYKLVVDVDHTLALVMCEGVYKFPHLAAVDFAVSDADDGYVIDSCSHGSTVTPDLSGPIGATDYGTFECGTACAVVAGPSVRIEYVDP